MNDRKFVFTETLRLFLGEAVCTAAMFGVFALLDRWALTVLLGGIVGLAVSVANFFFMAVVASLAADKAQAQDVKGSQAMIRASYIGRLLIMFIVFFAFAKSGLCNVLAMVLPLAFTRPIITVGEFFSKKEDANNGC